MCYTLIPCKERVFSLQTTDLSMMSERYKMQIAHKQEHKLNSRICPKFY